MANNLCSVIWITRHGFGIGERAIRNGTFGRMSILHAAASPSTSKHATHGPVVFAFLSAAESPSLSPQGVGSRWRFPSLVSQVLAGSADGAAFLNPRNCFPAL